MKRLISIVLTILLSTSLVSCGKSDKVIKVGVIDGYISKETIEKFDIKETLELKSSENTENGHGLMVLDIISSSCNNIEIYYVSVLNNENVSEISNICEALEWLETKDVDIINMSFATRENNEVLEQQVKELIQDEVVVVAACINYSNEVSYPAMYDGVISVSNCKNDTATICVGKKEKDSISQKIDYAINTSSLTAYYTTRYIRKLQKN